MPLISVPPTFAITSPLSPAAWASQSARIAAKRLRYLLEGVEDVSTGAAGLIEELKALQDTLGQLHEVVIHPGHR